MPTNADYLALIPENLGTQDFIDAYQDFIQFRSELKKPITLTGAKRALNKLALWGPTRGVLAIDNSIAHNWQDVYEPKEDVKPEDSWKGGR